MCTIIRFLVLYLKVLCHNKYFMLMFVLYFYFFVNGSENNCKIGYFFLEVSREEYFHILKVLYTIHLKIHLHAS